MANKWTDEQLEAIQSEGTSIIVSAGAGSGKTAVLTERVLRKLKEGTSVSELLILTFTKAAAAEMKERIRSAIRKEPSLKEELEKIDSAYITTFDSFALSVVKRYHYLLNISPNVSIMESSMVELKKKEIVDAIFDSYYEMEYEPFLKVIRDFCLKDDTEIKNSIFSIASKLELLSNKKEYLENYLDSYYKDENIDKIIRQYMELLFEKREILIELLDSIEDNVSSEYRNQITTSLKTLLEATTYEELKIDVKLPNLPRGTEEGGKKAKEVFTSALKEFQALLTYSSVEEIKNDIFSTRYIAQIFVLALQRYFEDLEQFKKNYDQYEFQDIAIYAIHLVQNYPEVAQELKSSFKEIMIDEYQDTNDLQETFISCISNHNVYMVGDIKQSIYRFRNANPYIFKGKYDRYRDGIDGQKIDLNKNFRSRREVLDDINLIFNAIMDDILGGADYPNGHQMIHGNQTYDNEGKTNQNYHMEILEYPNLKGNPYTTTEVEAFLIANDIKKRVLNKEMIFDKDSKMLRAITYSDFVILMDRATNFDLYKKIFEYKGIPLAIFKDETIHSGYDMDILRNLLTMIVKIKKEEYDTEYQYCFVSVARSYLFRYEDEAIFNWIVMRKTYETELYKLAKDIADQLDDLDNHRLLTIVLKQFQFYEKIITVGDVEKSMIRFDYLYGIADSLTSSGYDIYDFIHYFVQLKEEEQDIRYSLNTDLGDSVKIMTIHKSKGLEYPICYFSGLKSTFNMSDLKERFLFDPNYGMILPILKDGIGTTVVKDLLKNSSLKEEISEKIRLFYVALTRSKEKIILLLPETDHNSNLDYNTRLHYRSFADMLYSVYPIIENYIEKIDLDKLQLTKEYRGTTKINQIVREKVDPYQVKEVNLEIELSDAHSFSKEVLSFISREEEENMKFGRRFHQLLEQIDFQTPNYEFMSEVEKEKIKAFLSTGLFSSTPTASYKEYEFYCDELHGIIDLLLEYEDHFAIVDYKLKNVVDEAYLEQLNGYYQYLKTKTTKNIDLYLYSILDEQLVKVR